MGAFSFYINLFWIFGKKKKRAFVSSRDKGA